jgi:hypothetical protein
LTTSGCVRRGHPDAAWPACRCLWRWCSSPPPNAVAKQYLWNTYPQWVRAYITARGGLTSKLLTMTHAYAPKFLKPC